MQAIAFRQEKSSLYNSKRESKNISLRRDTENILHFSLQDSLPEGDTFALNVSLGTLSYISSQDSLPRLIAQQQFTANEQSMLLPLLEHYPYYCPYEVLYASFYNGTITDKTIELSRRQLQEALESGIWDHQMRPVRNVLSRTRLKTRLLGIDILSILETGYILRFIDSSTK